MSCFILRPCRYKVVLRDVPVEANADVLHKFMQKILQEVGEVGRNGKGRRDEVIMSDCLT